MKNILKRVYMILIVFLSLLLISPVKMEAAGGTGTPDDPYIIETAEELRALSGKSLAAHYKLGADIDLNGGNFSISSITSSGSFDGDGHTISNLKHASAGFVGSNSGTLKNINFKDPKVDLTGINYNGAAIVVGENRGVISNVHVINGSFTANQSSNNNRGKGGVVGINYGLIDYCSFSGTATHTNGNANIGGICGNNGAGTGGGVIRNCYNEGKISTAYSGAGGIVGYNSGSTVENCYNVGTVSGTASVGGVVGNRVSGAVRNTYTIASLGDEEAKKALTESLNNWIDSQSNPSIYKRWYYGDGRDYPSFDPIVVEVIFNSGDHGDFGETSGTPITEIKHEVEPGTAWDSSWVPTTLNPEEGYDFDGWDKDFPDTVEDTTTFTALWKLKEYSITWVNYDGTTLETDLNVPYGTTPTYNGQTPTKPSTETKTYTFSGWAPTVAPVSGDATYTAQYSEDTRFYTIQWVNDNGAVLEVDRDCEYDSMPSYDGVIPIKQPTAEYEYSFNGWDPTVEKVTGDATYTATYAATKRKYTVIWENYDHTVLERDVDVEYGTTPTYDGETPTKPSTPQKTYTFTGWDPAISEVTGNITYTALFDEQPHKYTIQWVDEDGTELEVDRDCVYDSMPSYDGETPTKQATAEYTYTFSGWTPSIVPVTEDKTYTATYTATKRKYTITWKNDDGTVLETDTDVEYGTTPSYDGATPTKPSTKKSIYTFDGWNPEIGPVRGETTYTAKYKEELIPYAITFNPNGGTWRGSSAPTVIPYTYEQTIRIPEAPTRSGYTFLYWKGSEYRPGDSYVVTEPHTFTAEWKKGENPPKPVKPTVIVPVPNTETK